MWSSEGYHGGLPGRDGLMECMRLEWAEGVEAKSSLMMRKCQILEVSLSGLLEEEQAILLGKLLLELVHKRGMNIACPCKGYVEVQIGC